MKTMMSTNEVAGLCNDWAYWVLQPDATGLGYPSMAVEAKALAGGRRPPGPIVPRLVMNDTCSMIDRAVRNLQDSAPELAALIRHKHIEGEGLARDKVRDYCMQYHCSQRAYYDRERSAYMFIAGHLAAAISARERDC